MSNSTPLNFLGTAAAIGGIALLPDTSGSPLADLLVMFIKISCGLVLLSSIALKLAKWRITKMHEKTEFSLLSKH